MDWFHVVLLWIAGGGLWLGILWIAAGMDDLRKEGMHKD